MTNALVDQQIPEIISQYNLSADQFTIAPVGSGYIHHTYKLTGDKSFILQRINKDVFKHPEIIASNIDAAAEFLNKNFPDYLFLSAIKTASGKSMIYGNDGYPWRLFSFFENTTTFDKVDTAEQAYNAAAEFGLLTRNLDEIDPSLFKPTIGRFHDLGWRYEQFQSSLKNATQERMDRAGESIKTAISFQYLVDEYKRLLDSGDLKVRITHNDTKINNVLFDSISHKTVCAIDLDTLMPGYFIYDLGDMIRTFVSPVDEEEKDLDKVFVRKDIYESLIKGYLSQMNDKLSEAEKKAVSFSGLMMTYIMALRMLTDFLNGDVYYQIRYEGQNLIRAKNQFKLLNELKNIQGV
jgi:Ser/Thr protein kinase RdoA (MazF antagonist)